MTSGAAFSRGGVLALVVGGFALFLAALYLIGAGEDFGGTRGQGQAHAASNGLNGYAGLVRLLEAANYDVARSRSPQGLETSGLLVLSQDGRVLRRLAEDAGKLEQEFIVDVEGELAPYGWSRLTHGTTYAGWPVAPFKVSWQSEQKLRFAIKGVRPGLLQHLCNEVGLRATAVRRLRLGRIGLAKMPAGQWRYLPVSERF